ncbi:MAG TPA: hypothetical protein PLN42_11345, partial [Anaerolineae bacterium]|nr:hypothetical protein [Anaerolineae bacterium]
VWGLRAGACAVVVDNVLKASGHTGQFDPEQAFSHDRSTLVHMARVASEAVVLLQQSEKSS